MRTLPLWALAAASCFSAASAPHVTPAPEGPFHVAGNRILDCRGRPFLLRGTQLPAFHPETAAHDSRSGRDFGPHSATSLAAIRLLFNMNAVRLPLDVRDSARPGYFADLASLVRRAHELELLVVLAAGEPAGIEFWTRCAAAFREDPNVLFDIGKDAHLTGWESWRRTMNAAIHAIRAAGAAQPVLARAWNGGRMFEDFDGALLDDPDVIYEVSGHYSASSPAADRDARFNLFAAHVPVSANGWDLDLDNPAACASLPSDPTVVGKMVRDQLEYFDRHEISWTLSEFQPGKLIKDYYLHAATTLEDGWTCGSAGGSNAGLGRLVEGHLRETAERSLFVVSDAGGVDLPRGAFAIGYGPVLANRDSVANGPHLPLKLGGVSIQITDVAGLTRPAAMTWASSGWGQVNFVIPDESAPGPAVLTIERDDGSHLRTPIVVTDTAPGIRCGLSLRGPALGSLVSSGAPIWNCRGAECRALSIPIRKQGGAQVRLMGTGFRHARSLSAIRVTVAGMSIPVVSYGPGNAPGMDQVTISIPPSLRAHGPADLITYVNGRVSNVAQVLLGADQDPGAFDWQLPRGFPAPRVPADNPISEPKARLGRYLFYDQRLSGNGTQSCATCHRQELAFTDGRATSLGSTGQSHPRSAMSLVNVAYNSLLTWSNPTLRSLEQQALVPMFADHPVELGLRGRENGVIAMLRGDPVYRDLFPEAFPGAGGAFSIANVARALAAFERTIISARSPYDRFHVGGDPDAISESAKRGETVFFSDPVAGCFRCHNGINFTDGKYHNTALYNPYPASNPGIGGKFKTPSLRNVALTAPYMHDGSIATLEEVLDHYSAGGRAHGNPNRDPLLHKFQLTPQNRTDLLAFLRSLTDEDLLHDPRFSNPW